MYKCIVKPFVPPLLHLHPLTADPETRRAEAEEEKRCGPCRVGVEDREHFIFPPTAVEGKVYGRGEK